MTRSLRLAGFVACLVTFAACSGASDGTADTEPADTVATADGADADASTGADGDDLVDPCGACKPGWTCVEGTCTPPCPTETTCTDEGTRECVDGGWRACTALGGGCLAWSDPLPCPGATHCEDGECVPDCVPDCDDHVCGDDGCGGSCGACDPGSTCTNGACVPDEVPPINCWDDKLPVEPTAWDLQAEGHFGVTAWSWDSSLDEACETHGFLIAGAAGMKVRLAVEGTPILRPRLLLADVAMASQRKPGTLYGDAPCLEQPCTPEIILELPYSGEYLALVTSSAFTKPGSYELTATCLENCDRAYTRFPLVLLHGMAGWDKLLNVYTYFLGVEDDLKGLGYDVHTTKVAMLNDTLWRATELETQLVQILTDTGARRLDLVAHSQGGLDARHFISGMGHETDVALLATVSTPHQGSALADGMLGLLGDGIATDLLAGFVNTVVGWIGGSENDVMKAFEVVTVPYMRDVFNPAHPDAPGVAYWSWNAESCRDLDADCRSTHDDEWIFPALVITYNVMMGCPNDQIGCGPNDGIVPANSAIWGEWKGTLYADHWDEVGQFTTGSFDHKALYRRIADMAFEAGF